jgi:hypothetical protein
MGSTTESMFKHLVEHHDLREQNIQYPALDRVTTIAERQDLLARCFTGLDGVVT